MSKKLVFLASSALLLLAPASLPLSAAAEPAKAMMQDKPKTDGIVAEAIKKAIEADKDLSFSIKTVQVKVEKGVVTLTGTVGSEKIKLGLENRAKSISGVEKVVNKIEVKEKAMERK